MRIEPVARTILQNVLIVTSVFVFTLSPVQASGLQIAPVSLTLKAAQAADGIWLSNEGETELSAQLRVWRWTQNDYRDKLSNSQGLVISPPMLVLAPGEKQLVRVIRTTNVPARTEEAWRLSIDELPTKKKNKSNQIQFVMHYSVPVFVQPENPAESVPKLQWKLVNEDDKVFIEASNKGSSHAQIAQIAFVGNNTKQSLTPGLLGYVLPGAVMRWPVSEKTRISGEIEMLLNGQKVSQSF